jgi:hypothetical protein
VQVGEQGAHLAAMRAAHLEAVRAGQARHQHRRLAGHLPQPLAVAVHQRRRHRQACRRQGRQQRQIGRQGVAVELLEHGQYHRARAAVRGPRVDQEGAVLNAVARGLRVLQPQRVVGQQGGQVPIVDTGIDGHQSFLQREKRPGMTGPFVWGDGITPVHWWKYTPGLIKEKPCPCNTRSSAPRCEP